MPHTRLPGSVPTVDEAELQAMIRERAHELSQIRRDQDHAGSPEEDWAQAASEIEPFVELATGAENRYGHEA